jgi:hypothetical protein
MAWSKVFESDCDLSLMVHAASAASTQPSDAAIKARHGHPDFR